MQHTMSLTIFGVKRYILVDSYSEVGNLPLFWNCAFDGQQPCRRGDMSIEEILKLKDVSALLKVGEQ